MRTFLQKVNRATIDYPHTIELYADNPNVIRNILQVVPFIYFFLLYQAFSHFVTWQQSPLFSAEQFDPRWTVSWLGYFSFDTAVLVVTGFFLVGMFVASLFFARLWARIVAFASLFVFHGFMSSFGGPDHNWLVWIYPLFFFILIPDVWGKGETSLLERKCVLISFLGAQVFIGLIYSMAGLSKLWRGVEQLLAGQANAFSIDAFALHIADWLPRIGTPSLLGPEIVAHPVLGWPLFLGMLYFQVFTLYAVFRPKLHRLWGIFLLLFYIANFLTMNIIYIDTFFLIAALLVYSPFERDASWHEQFREIPIFGWLYARVIARNARPKSGTA